MECFNVPSLVFKRSAGRLKLTLFTKNQEVTTESIIGLMALAEVREYKENPFAKGESFLQKKDDGDYYYYSSANKHAIHRNLNRCRIYFFDTQTNKVISRVLNQENKEDKALMKSMDDAVRELEIYTSTLSVGIP